MNLLSNAVKFTPEGGMVRLRAARRANAIFSVSDTGMGMSAEDKERLFTRFFRSPTAMAMAIPGTGLGLAIVKKIIDDHGGTIQVESVPGAGTTIEFTVPVSPRLPGPPPSALAAARGRRPPPPSRRRSVSLQRRRRVGCGPARPCHSSVPYAIRVWSQRAMGASRWLGGRRRLYSPCSSPS